MTAKPVAICCGEPAGIGPEIAAKAWAALRREVPMVWLGDPRHLPEDTPWTEIADCTEATAGDALPVLRHEFPSPATPGTPTLENAQGVIDVIARAVELVTRGDAAALCTAPIHKKVLMDGAGFAYPGHTEYLEALTGAPRAVMMLASDALRVVPTTIHIALEEVPIALTPKLLRNTIEITAAALREQFHLPAPRIAVAGLNPHAGEGGAMGRQELDWIGDLIAEMAADGLEVSGPWPADTMFHAAARARYDAAICMYHDQALIPIKTLDFDRGVNVTLGLPIIRTSPDHGTAFDIAGRDIANPTSMIEAIRLAHKMAQGA
ncbi:4-hydroxythreonine-4-phosphate dehydrogenase PdxA [Tateyamaria sp. ANG-S1]|uniref:4-hydroxythreonine-4-phosphate dehydrogenase PdxA n=1 Tax=Tateyamaria sp. ANG-S1 TaxID=1577905 RepID=UPI00057DC11D|nr:4-hydroxythreonine-4-phosphate dehydrogenase PdxA [Tateyamaria sp. ANG-S1]KIC48933.1 4-hydroxythreonine-4-phosphate dehydrogenase [Tateyamaria sp. ANG-S1]